MNAATPAEILAMERIWIGVLIPCTRKKVDGLETCMRAVCERAGSE